MLYGASAAGLVLFVLAVVSGDAPVWLWIVAVGLLAVTLPIIVSVLRLRMLPSAEREARLAAMEAKREVLDGEVSRSDLAYAATKHKKDVLASGIDGQAVVVALADGGRANEFRSLVYLELQVTVPGQSSFRVPTGEFVTAAASGSLAPGRQLRVKVDATDTSRVAVDWDASLGLR